MNFDVQKAGQEYICDSSLSYRELAKKYGVSLSTIYKASKEGKWIEKRKGFIKNQTDETKEKDNSQNDEKLSKLCIATDKTIECVDEYLNSSEDISVNELKNIASILKTLTSVQRDLNGILTVKEQSSLTISKQRLKLAMERIGGEDDIKGETGVVFIPFLADEETDNIFTEGEEDA